MHVAECQTVKSIVKDLINKPGYLETPVKKRLESLNEFDTIIRPPIDYFGDEPPCNRPHSEMYKNLIIEKRKKYNPKTGEFDITPLEKSLKKHAESTPQIDSNKLKKLKLESKLESLKLKLLG